MAAVFWLEAIQNTAAIASSWNQLSIVEHDVAPDPVPAVQRHALVQQLNNHIDNALEACKVEAILPPAPPMQEEMTCQRDSQGDSVLYYQCRT